MTFSFDWFNTTGKANFEKYLADLKGQPGLKFLEIGPFEGMATVWMLENILTAPDAKILVIDTFEGSMEHEGIDMSNLFERFKENTKKYRDKVVIIKGYSQIVLRTEPYNFLDLDFIYVDGSHVASEVLEDAILSFRMLKKDGIMIFDDYKWHKYDNDLLNPGPGIDAFLGMFDREMDVLLKDYQVVVRKK